MVQSGSDNSYGIYLAQMLFITLLELARLAAPQRVPALAAGRP